MPSCTQATVILAVDIFGDASWWCLIQVTGLVAVAMLPFVAVVPFLVVCPWLVVASGLVSGPPIWKVSVLYWNELGNISDFLELRCLLFYVETYEAEGC